MRGIKKGQTVVRAKRAENGMTLVELLVALTLLGLASLMLFGAIGFGARSWEAQDRVSSALEEVILAQRFLRDRISTLSARPLRANEDANAWAFEGERQRLSFVAPWLESLGQSAPYRFTLETIDEGLQVSWVPLTGSGGEEIDDFRGERFLVGHVEELQFRYYGAGSQDEDPRWHNIWPEDLRAPELIELRLDLGDKAGMDWPYFVAPTSGGL